MKRLLAFSLSDKTVIYAEVDEAEPEGGWRRAASPADSVSDKIGPSFDAALNHVRPAAEGIIHKLRALSDSPDEICVEFGIKLSAEAGAIIAAASAEANYKIILKWSKH